MTLVKKHLVAGHCLQTLEHTADGMEEVCYINDKLNLWNISQDEMK